MKILAPELTDHSESNLMVLLISMFAGLTEQLNYYIDNMAREAYITTARRYSSAVKLIRLIDYRIKTSIPASVDISVTISEPLPSPFTIPSGTEFITADGIIFTTTVDTIATTGDYVMVCPAQQKTSVQNSTIGITTGLTSQLVLLPEGFVDGSLLLIIGIDTSWVYKDTLGLSGPLDKHFTVLVVENQTAYIQFGDNINGAIPPGSQDIIVDLFLTNGASGNVDPDTINTFVTEPVVPGALTLTSSNVIKANGGLNVEGLASIRRRAPLSIRTLDRAVTRQDYVDIAIMSPGISKAALLYNCGKTIIIFVAPEGGGIAQAALTQSTKDYIDNRKMVTTKVLVKPAGESIINIKLTATANFRASGIQTKSDIQNILLDSYSSENSNVNKPVRKSDIYALIDGLAKVDFLLINEISLLPYPRPVTGSIQLIWSPLILVGSKESINWKLEYTGLNFNLFKEGNFLATIPMGAEFQDNDQIIKFTITASAYNTGQEWEFTTLPYNEDIETNDYSLPITDNAFLDITVIEQTVINN